MGSLWVGGEFQSLREASTPALTVLVGRVRQDPVFYHPPTSQPERGRKHK